MPVEIVHRRPITFLALGGLPPSQHTPSLPVCRSPDRAVSFVRDDDHRREVTLLALR